MKIKTDFVTNSSSSSFIIAMEARPTKEFIHEQLFKVPKNSFLYDGIDEFAKNIVRSMQDVTDGVEDRWFDEEIVSMADAMGLRIWETSFCTDDPEFDIERYIADQAIKIIGKDYIIYNSGI